MTPEEFELHMAIKVSWAQTLCSTTKMAIIYQFPEIQNLSVDMDEEGMISIIFEETIYTQDQVQNFVNELKRTPTK
jgi:(p)ppGpp synthase/HD superfamily hydrolase